MCSGGPVNIKPLREEVFANNTELRGCHVVGGERLLLILVQG